MTRFRFLNNLKILANVTLVKLFLEFMTIVLNVNKMKS